MSMSTPPALMSSSSSSHSLAGSSLSKEARVPSSFPKEARVPSSSGVPSSSEMPSSSSSVNTIGVEELSGSSVRHASSVEADKPTSSVAGIGAPTEKGVDSPPLSRIGLNAHKAGMEGLDRDRINQIILEASKGSKYYQNQVRRDQEIGRRVQLMLDSLGKLTPAQKAAAMRPVDKKVEAMELSRDLSQVIVHVDMDAFYAAVETRTRPELKDLPMAVGSNSMLSTSNYVARRFGVRAAMPGFIAKKLCPNLVIVRPNYEEYHKTSEEVRSVLAQYDPNFCPVGLDESYLDLTDYVERKVLESEGSSGPDTDVKFSEEIMDAQWDTSEAHALSKSHWLLAKKAVQEMREDIFKTTGLTASAGIAPNKMLAKVASDMNKPNGQCFVMPTREGVLKFVQDLPIRKICGIGKVTEKMLNALDITLCRHLYEKRDILHLLFSQTSSDFFLAVSLGLGSVTVQRSTKRKSMSVERSFSEIREVKEQMCKCQELCQRLAEDMEKEGIMGRTVVIKLKTVNFEVRSRGVTVPKPVSCSEELYQLAAALLQEEVKANGDALRLRLMGVRISSLQSHDHFNSQRTLKSFLRPSDSPQTFTVGEEDSATTLPTTDQKKAYNCSLPNLETTSVVSNEPPDTVACPVCCTQVSADNSALNQHIDECLNKSAVKEAPQGPINISAHQVRSSGATPPSHRSPRKRTQSYLTFYCEGKRKKVTGM